MTRDDLRAALKNRNVVAFLHTIREGESNQTDDAYTLMYGGQHFTSFADHPRRLNTARGITSTAAGAYQFLSKTWDGLVSQYGFEDFSPACQDEAAVALIAGRKALNSIIEGDLASTLDRCSWEWASLPPNRYGQSVMTAERTYETYDKWGGDFQPAIEPPLQENPMPFPALALAALPALIDSIPALTRLFGKGTQSEKNAQTAEKVIDIVKQATGAGSIEEAITKVTTEPEAKQAASAAIESAFYTLSEAGGGGIEGAREFNIAAGKEPFWHLPAFWITLALLPLLYGTVYIVLTSTDVLFSGELKAAIASSVVTGILGGVLGFWLGSSFGSQRKDAIATARPTA